MFMFPTLVVPQEPVNAISSHSVLELSFAMDYTAIVSSWSTAHSKKVDQPGGAGPLDTTPLIITVSKLWKPDDAPAKLTGDNAKFAVVPIGIIYEDTSSRRYFLIACVSEPPELKHQPLLDITTPTSKYSEDPVGIKRGTFVALFMDAAHGYGAILAYRNGNDEIILTVPDSFQFRKESVTPYACREVVDEDELLGLTAKPVASSLPGNPPKPSEPSVPNNQPGQPELTDQSTGLNGTGTPQGATGEEKQTPPAPDGQTDILGENDPSAAPGGSITGIQLNKQPGNPALQRKDNIQLTTTGADTGAAQHHEVVGIYGANNNTGTTPETTGDLDSQLRPTGTDN